jgi:polysaccharide pyruvyl transferase WcaK-like protein
MFVWAGGTGLSDYPQIGAELLENAQKLGMKTVIWQVGMNREFNPEYFQLHGRILKITEFFGITGYWERQMEKRMRERLQDCVSRCDLIALRDQPSLIELHNSGEFPAAVFGADSVILQEASAGHLLKTDAQNRRSVGICMAEKLNKRKFRQAVDFLRHLQITENVRLVFIPMSSNDRKIMEPLLEHFDPASGNIMIEYTAPEDIQNVVQDCSLLLSGRLQLTIMGLNALVPGIGVANSSKIANCLNMFGLPVFNNQSVIDFDQLYEECVRWLNMPEFALRAKDIRERMLTRLEQCESQLREL